MDYDYLVIATGTTPRPDETPGMDGPGFRDTIHEFYTFEGSCALADKLKTWNGGRLVVHVTEMPIKCPVALLEFTFLAEAYFTDKGMRDAVEITYVTPLEGAFTKPVASRLLGDAGGAQDPPGARLHGGSRWTVRQARSSPGRT